MTDRIALYCPKCRKSFKQRANHTNPKNRLTCASCGGDFLLTELKTASGKPIGKHELDVARDLFKKR